MLELSGQDELNRKLEHEHNGKLQVNTSDSILSTMFR